MEVPVASTQHRAQLQLPAVIPPRSVHQVTKVTSEENPLFKHFDTLQNNIALIGELQAQFNDSEQVTELDFSLREVIDAQKDYDLIRILSRAVFEDHRQNAGNTAQVLRERVEVDKANWRDMPAKMKYAHHDVYEDFKRRVFGVEHPEQDYPGTVSFFEARQDDDDMEMTYGSRRNLKCPLTLLLFVDPLRSKKCPHVFSKVAIESMIQSSNGRCECPIPGCEQVLTLRDLQPDRVMERRVREEEEDVVEGEPLSDFIDGGDDILVL